MPDGGERMRFQETAGIPKPELSSAQFLQLAGLRGFWPMSIQTVTGGTFVVDVATGHHLTNNSSCRHGYHGQAPYIQGLGLPDYLNHNDDAQFDIIGTEATIATGQKGLTLGCWVWADATAGDPIVISKWLLAGNMRSYLLYYNTATTSYRFQISSTGAAATSDITSTVSPVVIDSWHFVVCRWVPSTTIDIFVDSAGRLIKDTAVSADAAILNSTADLQMFHYVGSTFLTGRLSMCFLCAAALSDDTISFLYQQTKPMYRV